MRQTELASSVHGIKSGVRHACCAPAAAASTVAEHHRQSVDPDHVSAAAARRALSPRSTERTSMASVSVPGASKPIALLAPVGRWNVWLLSGG